MPQAMRISRWLWLIILCALFAGFVQQANRDAEQPTTLYVPATRPGIQLGAP